VMSIVHLTLNETANAIHRGAVVAVIVW
jgi:hypothetical protein